MSTEAQRVDDSPSTSGGSSDGDQRESVQQEPEREQVQPKKKEGKISSKTAAKLSTSAKRIQKELAEITLDPPPNCRYNPCAARAFSASEKERPPHQESSQITLYWRAFLLMGELERERACTQNMAAYIGNRNTGLSIIGRLPLTVTRCHGIGWGLYVARACAKPRTHRPAKHCLKWSGYLKAAREWAPSCNGVYPGSLHPCFHCI
ncbi:uncharacterized protein [Dipodomys merriami]|uniref:uncharacterized protein n=1 Tax=Dipodomys merriami TaxID=94247 RepID=UPI0038507296